MNPFLITGPAAISFSGGRTSGLMLRRVLDAHAGALPNNVHVTFSNTGKEREETLRFVEDCGTRWGVAIHWLERAPGPHRGRSHAERFREVSFATASRHGEPFDQLINERTYLPNVVTRFCTQELKIRTMAHYMRSCGYDHWVNVVGLRADERGRVSNALASIGRERWSLAFPLCDAGLTKEDVLAYWREQPFDLALKGYEGNCDLCFLKGLPKKIRILRENPAAAEWWEAAEARIGARFRRDYAVSDLVQITRKQPLLPMDLDDEESGVDCTCTG